MYQQERMDPIMRILKENHYVTVDHLVSEIRYSPASIRRDLTLLEKQGLVTRSYGGVTLKDANLSPFRFRQHSMKLAKNTRNWLRTLFAKMMWFSSTVLRPPSIWAIIFCRKRASRSSPAI